MAAGIAIAALAIVVEHLAGHQTGIGWAVLNGGLLVLVSGFVQRRVDPPAEPGWGRWVWSKERRKHHS
jgi:hypothetical protein